MFRASSRRPRALLPAASRSAAGSGAAVLGADAFEAARSRQWPSAADGAYPAQHALKRRMESLTRSALAAGGEASSTPALLSVLSLWALYQRGPYSPYAGKPFSCAVAAYSRLGLHLSAIKIFLAFPRVRWDGGLVRPAIKASAQSVGSLEACVRRAGVRRRRRRRWRRLRGPRGAICHLHARYFPPSPPACSPCCARRRLAARP